MKPIEDCLDTVLRKLKDNYALEPRPKLDSKILLEYFEVPQGRDEFFKGIINILIDDGYVDFLDQIRDRKITSLDTYKNRTIILPKGFYLLQAGGYTAASKRENSKKKIQNLKDWLFISGAWLAGIGAVGLVIWEIYKNYHSEFVCP